MNKAFLRLLILISFVTFLPKLNANDLETVLHFHSGYPTIIEKILIYKNDRFKVFYGGPIDRKNGGIKWMMPMVFEDDHYKTRAVYEVSFVNCDVYDAAEAEILFIDVSDINIKLQNTLSKDYKVFSNLLNGGYKEGKYIVIRYADVAIVYYPEIFISSIHSRKHDDDKKEIVQFLSSKFNTKNTFKDYYINESREQIDEENDHEIIFKPMQVKVDFDGKLYPFKVVKRIKKNDVWKVYYVISKINNQIGMSNIDRTLVRIDSGCVSGQIYDDDACDCLDQLHDGLQKLALSSSNNDLIIHIPAHDGRGFGTAPKAETEIYKRGGRGRVNSTLAIDTIAAAKLLYGPKHYDLRTYDGSAQILKSMNINEVELLTDNSIKVIALEKHGIKVNRTKTDTKKESCIHHIKAKKDSETYYSD